MSCSQSSIKQQEIAKKQGLKKEINETETTPRTWKTKYNIEDIRKLKVIWDTVAKGHISCLVMMRDVMSCYVK